MRKSLVIFAICSCLLGGVAPVYADMQSGLLDEYKSSEAANTKIVTEESLPELSTIIANPEMKVVCLQILQEQFDPQYVPTLMDWVRQGGSVWFYDARLAPYFGMKLYKLDAENFRGKSEKGNLGENKDIPGCAVTVYPIKGHSIGTGVASVAAWLPLLEKENSFYGVVQNASGVENLLQFAADSPAIAALRRVGYGTVVFKPLLWEKSLSGERFQRNLIEFCAGYGVPGTGGIGRVGEILSEKKHWIDCDFATSEADVPETVGASAEQPAVNGTLPVEFQSDNAGEQQKVVAAWEDGKAAGVTAKGDVVARSLDEKENSDLPVPEVQLFDHMKCTDGDHWGKIMDSDLRFESGTSSHHFKPSELQKLEIGQFGNLDTVVTADGKTMRGMLMVNEITILTDDGKFKLKKRDVSSLEFNVQR